MQLACLTEVLIIRVAVTSSKANHTYVSHGFNIQSTCSLPGFVLQPINNMGLNTVECGDGQGLAQGSVWVRSIKRRMWERNFSLTWHSIAQFTSIMGGRVSVWV